MIMQKLTLSSNDFMCELEHKTVEEIISPQGRGETVISIAKQKKMKRQNIPLLGVDI